MSHCCGQVYTCQISDNMKNPKNGFCSQLVDMCFDKKHSARYRASDVQPNRGVPNTPLTNFLHLFVPSSPHQNLFIRSQWFHFVRKQTNRCWGNVDSFFWFRKCVKLKFFWSLAQKNYELNLLKVLFLNQIFYLKKKKWFWTDWNWFYWNHE